MKRVAVIAAPGFEEAETTTIVDVIRRAGFECKIISINDTLIEGAHGIIVGADELMESEMDACLKQMMAYDMLVLPGGWTGVEHLENDRRIIRLVEVFNQDPEKYLAAMCAAPSVFAKAGIVKGRLITSYPGPKLEPLFTESNYTDDAVAFDYHMITSRGPATSLPFAFALVDVLGGDSANIKERFLYNALKKYPDGLEEE